MARKMGRTHRVPEQKPAHADDKVKVTSAQYLAPRHPTFPRRNPQRTILAARRIQDSMERRHQISHLASGNGRGVVRMRKVQQGIPRLALLNRFHQNQRQAFHRRNPRRRSFQTPGPPPATPADRSGPNAPERPAPSGNPTVAAGPTHRESRTLYRPPVQSRYGQPQHHDAKWGSDAPARALEVCQVSGSEPACDDMYIAESNLFGLTCV